MAAQTVLPINWEQGLFLQPQHFQLTDLYHQYLLTQRLQFISPNFWGAVACEVDQGLLENGIFSLKSGTFVTEQGAIIHAPENCQLSPRAFADQVKANVQSWVVYLGIKELSLVEPNVTAASEVKDANTRFISTKGEDEQDLYNKGPHASVKQLQYAAKLFWDTEAAQVQNYVLLPIAKLVKTADKVILDSEFVPVCMNIRASENLYVGLQRFYENLLDRVAQLELLKKSVTAYDNQGHIKNLLLLSALGRSVATITHLLDAPVTHPETLYVALTELVAEISTFTGALDVLGRDRDGNRLLVAYQHDNLLVCVLGTCDLILSTLNQIILTSERFIQGHKEENLYVLDASKDFFTENQSFYLLVQADADRLNDALEHINTTSKLCAYSEIDNSLAYSLPGAALQAINSVPEGVPKINDCLYFVVDKTNVEWLKIEKDQRMAFYVGNLPLELNVSMAAS